jgi:hypothetical protein
MIPRYPCMKKIKIDYETQFSIDSMLNDEIKKKKIKNDLKNDLSQLVKYYSLLLKLE